MVVVVIGGDRYNGRRISLRHVLSGLQRDLNLGPTIHSKRFGSVFCLHCCFHLPTIKRAINVSST